MAGNYILTLCLIIVEIMLLRQFLQKFITVIPLLYFLLRGADQSMC